MAAYINQVIGRPAAGTGDTYTTSSIDTTGANFLYASTFAYTGAGGYSAPAISDSKGNTWTALTFYAPNNHQLRAWYSENATTGTGHTFTVTTTDAYCPVTVQAFSGVKTSSSLDQQTGAVKTPASTHQPGSLTPSEDNCLVMSSLGTNPATITSINSSFQAVDKTATTGNTTDAVDGDVVSESTSYLIQTTAAAVNPTWTLNVSDMAALNLVVFKSIPTASDTNFFMGAAF